jgi:hypothetical protein
MDRAPIYLEKHLDGWKWSNAEGKNTQNTYMMPWKKEDAVDTPLELLTDYVRTKFGVLALIDKDRAEEDPEEYAHQKWMQYGFFNEVFTFIRNPYAPSIVRCGLPNILNMFQKELSMKSVESIIHDMFGISDFHKPYGADIMKESTVSPHMLKSYERILEKLDKPEYVGNDEIILSGIPRSMEDIFLSAPEYFKNMNSEQYESLASLLAEKLLEYQDSLPSRDAVDVLQYLVALNGPKNVKGYINHICNIARDAKAESSDPKAVIRWYSDYIRILLAMKDLNEDDKEELNITIKLDWKIKGTERIQERHEEVIYIYNSLSNEILCRQYNEAFEKTSKKWLGYDYSEDEFSVILPQNPLEIAYEGLSLNHCVKSYIEDVSNGKTNIFFVRRTNDLKKPFYTLEVRDNAIRQCHGFNNKNTDEVAGLADFIRRYCEAKGITCKGMNRVLAV